MTSSLGHRPTPHQGFDLRRVFTEDGALDEIMAVAAPYGDERPYLDGMAGPHHRWRFPDHSDHDRTLRRGPARGTSATLTI